jgi:PmbA protein
MNSNNTFDRADFERVLADLLAEAKAQGASSAEADVSIVKGLSVGVRLGEVETVEFNQDRGLGVTVYFGKRRASASTSDFSAKAVKETVEAACGIAKYTAEDPCSGLADPERMAYGYPDLDLCHGWDLSAEQAIDLAKNCEAAARDFDKRITNSEGASVSTHESLRVYGNSHGFIGSYPATRHSISCSVIAQQGESMQRDYWYSSARLPAELTAVEAIGKRAAERAVRRLNGRRLATTKAPVIFSAETASGLLSHFLAAIRGESLYRRSSFLLDCIEKQVFPAFVNIGEQPHLPRALGSAPFDAEGVITRSHALVSEGVVRSYVLDSYSARKLGMQSTGNAGGVHNLTIEPGAKDLAHLIRDLPRGLLVTELMGQGVNKVTGDYSRGAAGFWIEHGEIQFPVEEITIAGNLKDMFSGIREVGRDVELQRNIRTGSILIEQMTIAGE